MPTLIAITPTTGPAGTIVTLQGIGFVTGTIVWFESATKSTSDPTPVILGDNRMQAMMPDFFADTETINVYVVTPDGQASQQLAFTLSPAASTSTLCTVGDVKEFLGVAPGDTINEGQLARAIRVASNQIRTYCKTTFTLLSIIDEAHDGDGTQTLFLDRTPVLAVTALRIGGQIVDPSECKVYRDYIKLLGSSSYDARLGGCARIFPQGTQNVEVSYQAGYTTVPADIVDACVMQAVFVQNLANKHGILSETNNVAQATTTYAQTQLAPSVRTICNQYRPERMRIV